MFERITNIEPRQRNKIIAALIAVIAIANVYAPLVWVYGFWTINLLLAVLLSCFTAPEIFAIRKQLKARELDEPVEDPPLYNPPTLDDSAYFIAASVQDGMLAEAYEAESLGEESITTRRHWMMLFWPSTVLVYAIIASVMVFSSESTTRIVLSMLFALGFAMMVGVPYVMMVYRLLRKIRQINRMTLVIRLAAFAGTVLFIASALLYFGVSAHSMLNAVRWVIDQTISIVRAIPWTIEALMSAIVVLAFIKLLLTTIDWSINTIILTDRQLIENRGILRNEPGTVPTQNMEATPVFWKLRFFKWTVFQLPWGSLVIETPGQNQAIEVIHWVPRWFADKVARAAGN